MKKVIESTNLEEQLTRHHEGDSDYTHQGTGSSKKVLIAAVCLTLGYAVIEVIGGFLSNSLALLSDAGHMVTDSASLFFALLANVLAGRPASGKYSFGFAKLEVLAALLNALAMFAVVLWIVVEAVERFSSPVPVNGSSVFLVATLGLLINIAVAWTLSRDQKSINTRAALLHVMGDLLGSVAAITAGIVIYFGGPVIVDPYPVYFCECFNPAFFLGRRQNFSTSSFGWRSGKYSLPGSRFDPGSNSWRLRRA